MVQRQGNCADIRGQVLYNPAQVGANRTLLGFDRIKSLDADPTMLNSTLGLSVRQVDSPVVYVFY